MAEYRGPRSRLVRIIEVSAEELEGLKTDPDKEETPTTIGDFDHGVHHDHNHGSPGSGHHDHDHPGGHTHSHANDPSATIDPGRVES
jgi:hypothetical protein